MAVVLFFLIIVKLIILFRYVKIDLHLLWLQGSLYTSVSTDKTSANMSSVF